MKYDVIVVGGRVAGSVSSLFASKNDINVLMIEKRQEIGTPVQCAGATSYKTFETLEMKPSKKYVRSEVYGADLYSPDGSSATLRGPVAEGLILERKIFDKELAIKSAKAGTDIMLKTNVKDLLIKDKKVKGVIAKHLGKTMEITADLVIAADGLESQIAKKSGLNTTARPFEICSCAQYEMVGLDINPNYLKFYFGEKIAPGGYVWIFPKGDRVANVGIGIRSLKQSAYYYLNKFIVNLNAKPVELNIGGVPVSGPIEKTFTDGLLVVGDAARQVDPITGGGIHIASACGKIAGEVAAEAIQKEDTSSDFLVRYEKLWKEKVGKSLKRSLKYRNALDNMDDDDLNNLISFAQGKDVGSLSKLSMIKLAKDYPQLVKILKDLL
ncbi:MAG: digeranylgeranylglycerophospholipid reductase [Methanobacterium sp. BRmetb2]|jgi:digeranylgeranylglycerophospholipid reductase|nr:MAG: digeranylgeranylglycerophospholipid reductase [Methanobacterium sp. BRmetb2]